MFCLGDAMIKQTRKDNPYRTIYLERKELEKTKDADARPIVHHRRAQRYMEKRMLLDLWEAWNEAQGKLKPINTLPDFIKAA